MKLDITSINFINVFENLTGAKVKDCIIEEGKLVFVVDEANVSRAIGKNGANVNKAKNFMKKEIQIIGFNDDVTKFVSNLLYPVKVEDIKLEGKIVNVSSKNTAIKGKIFGRNKENLKRILNIVKRYFDIEEIKIE